MSLPAVPAGLPMPAERKEIMTKERGPGNSRTPDRLGGPSPTTLSITELSRRTSVPSSAIRYYESIGLLAPVRRTKAGYRLYDHEAEGRIQFIRMAQAAGLTLDDVR